MTTSGTTSATGGPDGDNQGPPTPSFHPEILIRWQDDSKDRQSRREIEKEDATAHRDIRKWLVKATIGTAGGVFLLGAYLVSNHQDPKVRELSVSLISAPIAGLFGVLAGMGLK